MPLTSIVMCMLAVYVLNVCDVGYCTNAPFSKGEIINYDVEKFKLKIGEATLAFDGAVEVQGKQALKISFTARGFKFLDEEEIYVDARTFYPVLIKRNLSMFGVEERITEFYDSQKGKVRVVKIAKGETTEQVIENGPQFDNIYGFIYRQRQLGRFGRDQMINLHLPTRDLQFKFVEQDKISVADQEFDAIYMRSTPRKYEIWFDSSVKRIPLKINGTLGLANMSMVLKTP